MEWFTVHNIDTIDSPALLVYKERVRANIQHAINMIGDINRLRPHVKTNKIAEVCIMMQEAGIHQFKCATIAEAEMLAIIGVKDVLLAYQPTGPKQKRWLALVQQFPQTTFACLIDNIQTAKELSSLFTANHLTATIFIDVNTGMNRSGILPDFTPELATQIQTLNGIYLKGLHGYDGHIRDTILDERTHKSNDAYQALLNVHAAIQKTINYPLQIVVGGSPTFPTHTSRKEAQCSPGTFVFWDWGYKHQMPDEPFDYAALVLSRVISVVNEHTITTDLGHKSVAAENPFPRVHFLNAPDAKPIGQSEEHLVLQVPDASKYKVGDVLYGVPVHICPTVALYDTAQVVENNIVTQQWKVIARDRSITI